jgi:hypothetical protein
MTYVERFAKELFETFVQTLRIEDVSFCGDWFALSVPYKRAFIDLAKKILHDELKGN